MLNKKRVIVIGVAFFLVTALAFPAQAQYPDPGPYSDSEVSDIGTMADLVILRPLGIAATAIGSAFFVASLPFTIWSRENLKRAGKY